MKYIEKLAGPRQLKSANRNPQTWFFLLYWLLLSICSAQAQEVVESQSLRFRLIPGGTYLLGSPADEPGRYADEARPSTSPPSGKWWTCEKPVSGYKYLSGLIA